MATSKTTSRWGSFLNGLESKLDTILADEDPAAKRPGKADGLVQGQAGKKDGLQSSERPESRGESIVFPHAHEQGSRGNSLSRVGPARSASTTRAQDRLNERLAKAMASRNITRKNDAFAAPNFVSRTASPVESIDSSKKSIDIDVRDFENGEAVFEEPPTHSEVGLDKESEDPSQPLGMLANSKSPALGDELNIGRNSIDSRDQVSARQSLELDRPASKELDPPGPSATESNIEAKSEPHYEQIISQMRADYEVSELRRQEETHDYLERIDALQAKLQYLTKEAAEAAKNALSEAKPGSIEHKLAEKDEKISLLIDEGQKLSHTELKHMSMIKKLHAKVAEDQLRLDDIKKVSDKYEKAARDAQERVRRIENNERLAADKTKAISKLEKELENTRKDRDAKAVLAHDLQRQLSKVTSQIREAEDKVQIEALEAEKKLSADLKEELSTLRSKTESIERQNQIEIRNLREKHERERERARIASIEQQNEQKILETRLEALRARAEEASAGNSGDSQAKLLRQIETLQNQYAVASENWQGIEGSLLAKIAMLQKERDDIAKRESDIRRKVREMNTKSQRMEEELEMAMANSQDLVREISEQRLKLANLQEKLVTSEVDLAEARKTLDAEREAWDARHAHCIEGEKARQVEDSLRTPDGLDQHFHTESPVSYGRTRKTSYERKDSPHNKRPHGLAILGTGQASLERPISRRSSTQPFPFPDSRPMSRQASSPFIPQLSINDGIPETPFSGENQEDFFEGIKTPGTPDRTINDMISGSATSAGPSVQLVERMSAAVRRLESEKAASKDELARLLLQRDEAREQVVSLMKESEEKQIADERIKELEKQVNTVNEQYLATLEQLGEKIEKVEELKADVVDLKQMYRELVENTVR